MRKVVNMTLNLNESLEMYLETIYLLEENHGHVHGVDIAKKMGVSKPSVSKAMNQLKKNGLVNKEVYGSITLTDTGKKYSEKVYRKHKTITKYLQHSLGLDYDQACKNACKMEHVLTDEMFDAVEVYLEENQVDLDL